MPPSFSSVKQAISAVKSGKHTPDHVATLRKTKEFLANNKSHSWNKSANLHHALRSIPGLKERYITRDNLIEALVQQFLFLSEGMVKDVLTHDLGRAHPRPGKLPWWMRPFGRATERNIEKLGKYNPNEFYPAGNMMSPHTGAGSSSGGGVKSHAGHIGWKIPVAVAAGTAAGVYGIHRYRQARKTKERKERTVAKTT